MVVRRFLAVVVAAYAVGACAEAGEPATAPTGPAGLAASLPALPECPSPPPGIDADVPGLQLPEGSVVISTTDQKPVVNVSAFVPMTPAQFEASYRGLSGVTVLLSENEVFEAELLISRGSYRNFLKATATCEQGSQVLAVVAPEVDAQGLPLPQGAATATPLPGATP